MARLGNLIRGGHAHFARRGLFHRQRSAGGESRRKTAIIVEFSTIIAVFAVFF